MPKKSRVHTVADTASGIAIKNSESGKVEVVGLPLPEKERAILERLMSLWRWKLKPEKPATTIE